MLTFAPSDWLYGKYADWMRDNVGFSGCINRTYFFRQMGEMNDLGLVSRKDRKTHHGDQKYRGYIRYDPDQRCHNIRASDVEFVSAVNESGKVIEMRSRIKSKIGRR